MWLLRWVAALVSILVCALTELRADSEVVAPRDSAPKTKLDTRRSTVLQGGLEFTITAPAREEAGKPIRVCESIRNVGPFNANFFDPLENIAGRFEVRDAKGKVVAHTAYGLKCAQRPDGPAKKPLTVRLASTDLRDRDYTLTLYYDLTLPGEYTLIVRRVVFVEAPDGEVKTLLQSKEVRFEITAPEIKSDSQLGPAFLQRLQPVLGP